MLELEVEFDDGDSIATKFNGTVQEAYEYYMNSVFTGHSFYYKNGNELIREWPRRAVRITFFAPGSPAALGVS
jgi:hypothetical protein